MINKIYLPNGTEAIEAEYKTSVIGEYNNNPFIQALPELVDEETIIRRLIVDPIYLQEERQLDSSVRLHMLYRLFQFFQPLPKHIEIWNMVNTLIRQGYLARNIFDKEYKKYVNEVGEGIINRSFDIDRKTNFRTTASSALIIGYSGMGKTTTVNRVLSHIPQVIVHNYYDNQHFSQIQLTWLKLEAPHNSSLKALTLQFFMKIDELLGTENFKRYVSRNLSVDAMMPLMGKVAQNVGLGALFIDELQHLNNKSAKEIMNYFVTLINSFGVPIVFIGTPASYDLLQNEFRIARRVSGNGEVIWNNMDNDEEFELFMNGIWRYQWTKKNTDLNQEIIDLFYKETQGISDLIVKFYVNAQHRAIISGEEKITKEIILSVAKEEFKMMKPMLDAISSKNPYKTIKYEDLRRVEEVGFNASNVEKISEAVIAIKRSNNVNKTRVSNEIKLKPERIGNKKVKVEDLEEDDMRFLLDKGKSVGKNIYEILMENDLIDDLSFLDVGEVN